MSGFGAFGGLVLSAIRADAPAADRFTAGLPHPLIVAEGADGDPSRSSGRQVARESLISGPRQFLYLLAFFSLQLGILNLLPIPVLDGGHILILMVEGVIRRELPEIVKERVMQAGFVFLLAFMGLIVVLDIVKSI